MSDDDAAANDDVSSSNIYDRLASFHQAIAANDRALVAAHLAANAADVNLASPWSGVAVAVAVDASVDDAILALLLNAGADVSVADDDDHGNTPLHVAVQRGNERHVALLLSLGNASVTKLNSARNSALHLAAKCPDQRILQLLLAHDATGDARQQLGALQRTPLHVAATNANVAVAQLLIDGCSKKQSLISAADCHGQTPLHLAVVEQNVAVAKALIDAGAQLEALDSDRRSVLHLAAERTDVALVQMLLAAGAKLSASGCDRHGRSPLHRAAALSSGAVVAALLAHCDRALVNQVCNEQRTPCHYAAANADETAMAALLSVGCDFDQPDAFERTPCFVAAKNANERPLAMLVAAGCDTACAAVGGERPCHAAAANANEKLIGVLLAAGVNCDAVALGTPCHIAAANANEKVLAALIAGGADFRTADAEGDTPAHIAAANSNERVAAALVAAGASFSVVNRKGETPLHTVAQHGNARVAALLLTTDAIKCLERGGRYGYTPLSLAVRHESDKVVELFVSAGADPNGIGDDGWPPMTGLSFRSVDTLAVLVAGGADASLAQCNASMNRAVWAGNPDVIAMLLVAGSSLDVTDWQGVTARERIANMLDAVDTAKACRLVAAKQVQLIRRRAADVVIGLQPLALDALQMCEVLLHACGPLATAVPFHKLWAIAVAAKHFRR
jgi:ankyrin repeat protein